MVPLQTGDVKAVVDNLIKAYLHSRGFTSTLEEFQSELNAADTGLGISELPHSVHDQDLIAIVENWLQSQQKVQGTNAVESDDLLFDGESSGEISLGETLELKNVHSNNIIAAEACGAWLYTGGSDCNVCCMDLRTRKVVWKSAVGSAAVTVAVTGSCVAVGLLSGQIAIFKRKEGDLVQEIAAHCKFIRKLATSSCGKFLASGGGDGKVCVFAASSALKWEKIDTLDDLRGPPESLQFLDIQGCDAALLVGTRNSCCFVLQKWRNGRVGKALLNMNANGDDWISFAPMDIALSPSKRHFAVFTNSQSGRIVLYKVPAAADLVNDHSVVLHQSLVLYGPSNDDYSQPKLCFSPCGRFLAATSNDYKVLIYDLSKKTGRLVLKLADSKSTVRAVTWLQTDGNLVLVTAGYDRVIRVYIFISSVLKNVF